MQHYEKILSCAVINTLWENAFLEGITYKTKAKHSEFVKIFNCGLHSFEKLARKSKIVYASIKTSPWNDFLKRLILFETKIAILMWKQRWKFPATFFYFRSKFRWEAKNQSRSGLEPPFMGPHDVNILISKTFALLTFQERILSHGRSA